ncbi:MAG: ABC transporter permease, partial [Chloroflexota bacterium]
MVDQSSSNTAVKTLEAQEAIAELATDTESRWGVPNWFKRMVRAVWPLLAAIILIFFTVISIFGPQIAPKDPNRQNLILRLMEPFTADEDGVVEYPLGTDALGRDVLSRLLYGARISLWVG